MVKDACLPCLLIIRSSMVGIQALKSYLKRVIGFFLILYSGRFIIKKSERDPKEVALRRTRAW
jgi:hypothetical protein